MKIVGRGIVISMILHIFYIISLFIVGYVRTWNYEPDLSKEYAHVQTLSSEVAFGSTGSPSIYIFIFIGGALLVILIQKIIMKTGKPL
ncbi:hypothetical protein FZW96_08695 [Bacillus sp. BGMRC 2118]|nr:hypothetical protein FZW96_08695 [Bacillus sp. BGMRC 2118]